MFSISLNRVRDRIAIKEGDESIVLHVDVDARVIVTKIRVANEKMEEAKKPGADDKQREAAAYAFSDAIFGPEQTKQLADFYHGDYSCVITVCGLYFEKRLAKKITRAQKRRK